MSVFNNLVLATGAATTATAAAQAFAYGYIIVKPDEFIKLLNKSEKKVVVLLCIDKKGVFKRSENYVYITKYGDFIVMTKSSKKLVLPSNVEIINIEKLVLPIPARTALDSLKT